LHYQILIILFGPEGILVKIYNIYPLQCIKSLKISGEYDLVQYILTRHNMYYNMVKSLPYKKSYNGLTQPKKYKKYVNI